MTYQYNKRSSYRKAVADGGMVFCMNQLGGVGRKRSQFLSTADGVKDCVEGPYHANIEPNLPSTPQCYKVAIENYSNTINKPIIRDYPSQKEYQDAVKSGTSHQYQSYEPEGQMLEGSAAWQRKAGKNSKGGLNEKGRKSYEAQNPGSDLKAPVTGKVKPGGKAAKRRKSFCARMGGMKGPMKKPNGKPTRKALALRKWKC